MNTRSAARRWADTWQRCWEANDAGPIVALYAPSAVYAVAPFRAPNFGTEGARTYLLRVLSEEAEVQARFGEPIVDGARAAVQWWTSYIEDGRDITIAGTSVLRFDDDGLVIDEWDAWDQTDGRLEPSAGWGAA